MDWNKIGAQPQTQAHPGGDDDFDAQLRQLEQRAKASQAVQPSPARAATSAVDIQPRQLPGTAKIDENTPWSTVGSEALKNAPESAKNAISDVASAVWNYDKTIPAIGNLAYGIGSKAYGLVGQQDPKTKAQNEGVIDAVIDDYKDKYGSVGGLKNRLANDPFNIGMDAATVMSGGVGAAGKIGMLEKAGNLAKAAKVASIAADPVALAAKTLGTVAKPAVNALGDAAKYAIHGYQSIHSGSPMYAYDMASKVGTMTGPEGARARDIFRKAQSKQLTPVDIAETAERAFTEAADLASKRYREKFNGIVDFDAPVAMNSTAKAALDVDKFLKASRPMAGDVELANDAIKLVGERYTTPSMRTLEGLDHLKRNIRQRAAGIRDEKLKKLVYDMANGAKADIVTVDPKYAELMTEWQDWMDTAANLKSELGAGNPRAAQTTIMKKLKGSMKDKVKREQMDILASTEAGRDLPYMMAGHELSDVMPHWMQGGGFSAAIVPAALSYLNSPFAAVSMLPAAVSASPKIGGMLNERVGGLKRGLGAAADAVAPYTPGLNNLGANVGDLNERMGRKSGGRVQPHVTIGNRLVMAADRAKKTISKQTEPLLNTPDETIVHALEVANRSI